MFFCLSDFRHSGGHFKAMWVQFALFHVENITSLKRSAVFDLSTY